MGGRSEYGRSQTAPINKFPKDDSQLKHVFRDDEGHILEDTPENRKLLLDTASDSANYKGKNEYGCKWYTKIREDGTEVWVSIRNGIVQNGGINSPPWNDWSHLEV